MERNVGGIDRLLRLTLGPLLLIGGVLSVAGVVTLDPITPFGGSVAVVAGIALTVNGLTQRCGLNALLGINTCTRRS